MDNRRSKVKRSIIVLVVIACIVAIIGGTYARYSSTGTANANIQIAKWSVKLDGEDISTTSKTVYPTLTYSANQYVKDGKIAPGRSATFSVQVDPTDSEVAIDYSFAVDTSSIATALLGEAGSEADITVSNATCTIGGTDATITKNGDTYTVAQGLSSVESDEKVVVTFTITWANNDTNTAIDTAEGVASAAITDEAGKVVTFPVVVTASQHI